MMERNKKLSMKDRLTIHIRKQKPAALWVLLVVCVVLLAVLVVMSMTTRIEMVKAPAVLTNDDVAFRMTVAGDILVDDSIRAQTSEVGYFNLLRGLRNYWDESDCVIANFCGPILRYRPENYTTRTGLMEEAHYLRPAALRGFLKAGITMPSFANEKTFNYGITGIRSTLSVLDEYKTPYLGIAADNTCDFYKILNFSCVGENGVTQEHAVSVMSMNDIVQEGSTVTENRAGILNSTMSIIREKIFEMAQCSDLVVLYLHFGEINSVSVTEDQRELCQELIDAGADIVVGSHSRMVQPIERYGDGLIVYDLGEVISTADYSAALDGTLLDITILNDGTVSAYLTPTRIKESRPVITDNWFYQKRITKMLTTNLDKSEYQVTDTGAILIPLGQLNQ